MKIHLLLYILVVTLGLSARAGIRAEVNESASNVFLRTTVQQETSLHEHEARIIYKGQTATIFLDDAGKILRYEMPVTYAAVPIPAQFEIRRIYGLNPQKGMTKVIDASGTVRYRFQQSHHTLWFSAAGKRL